jgi:hypothetical protein
MQFLFVVFILNEKEQWMMLTYILVAVHIAIAVFAILSRAQTGLFAMQYSLFAPNIFSTPIKSGVFNVLLSLLLLIPNLTLYFIIKAKSK